jgi:hypothetical protein
MAHQVNFGIPERDLGKVDIDFVVIRDGSRLGRLKISKGGLDYYPRNAKKPITKSWTQLDRLFQE